MLCLQRISRNVTYSICRFASSSARPAVSGKVAAEPVETKLKVDKSQLNSTELQPKNPIVAAAFASLNQPDVDFVNVETWSNKQLDTTGSIDEQIIEAKTVNELLLLAEKKTLLTRKHALKIVSILAEWSSINRVELTDFEHDPRFIRLCRVLGRVVQKQPNQMSSDNTTEKQSKTSMGVRNDDLSTVLNVTGDDEAAKLIASISLPQMVKVMTALGQKRRRSTPLLRSLAFNISGKSDVLDLKQCADLLYAMAVLNFPDTVLSTRICVDIQTGLANNKDRSAVVGSILTSLGILKFRNTEVLDSLAEWMLQNNSNARSQDIAALFLTLATLNYPSQFFDKLKSNLASVLHESDLLKPTDWLKNVWALAILDMATGEQINSVLNSEFLGKLAQEGGNDLSPTIKMKLLNLNAYTKAFLKDYKGAVLAETSTIFTVPLIHTKSKQTLTNSLIDALKGLFASEVYVKTNTNTNMGFVIDAECVLDQKCNPLPINKNNANGIRVAIMMLDFHDMCRGGHEMPTGVAAFALRLLEQNGYRVLKVPYTELNASEKLLKRVQYVEKNLKSIASQTRV